jgi:hypothetical protein
VKTNRILVALLAMTGSLFTLPVLAAEAGTVERVSGTATVVDAENRSRPVRENEALNEGETVATERGAEVLVKLKDDTKLVVRANTQLRFTEFRYSQAPTDSMVLSLLRGGLRAVTGLLGKNRPGNVRFSTVTATVGIRGTDFEIVVLEEGNPEGRAGSYNYVHDGETLMQVASGESLGVRPEQTGFAPERLAPGEAPLQLLRERPAFLRGGGFDALMMQLTNQPRMIAPMIRGR